MRQYCDYTMKCIKIKVTFSLCDGSNQNDYLSHFECCLEQFSMCAQLIHYLINKIIIEVIKMYK